jgi:hypothetical protein
MTEERARDLDGRNGRQRGFRSATSSKGLDAEGNSAELNESDTEANSALMGGPTREVDGWAEL